MKVVIQKHSLLIMLGVFGAVAMLAIGIGFISATTKPAVAIAQSSEQKPQAIPAESQVTTAVPVAPTNISTSQVKPVATSAPITTQLTTSIYPPPPEVPVVGILIGNTIYDASCNTSVGICSFPFAGRTVEVRNSKKNIVASTVSDSNGKFSFKLSPGTYTITAGPGVGVNPLANPQQVTITRNSTTDVTIQYWAIATTNIVLN